MIKKSILLAVFLLLTGFYSQAQTKKLPLFDNKKLLDLVDYGGDFIYNESFDSAQIIIDSLAKFLPDHPIIYMMEAMNYAWQDQPMRTTRPIFEQHQASLNRVIVAAEKIKEKDLENLEALFFEMSAHGLLAEYYAREGTYMKAVTQATQTYTLIKKTMDQTSRSPEFYFLAGLYNYFREMYPERHPVYKSFLWVFKSGDKAKGLVQLDSAVHYSKIVKIEASLYLAYIYLRYENNPKKSIYYVKRLLEEYPNNSYFKTKYIECLVLLNDYQKALPIIRELLLHSKPYYRMCGQSFMGMYEEKVNKSDKKAEEYYLKSLETGAFCLDRGEYYRSVTYLGLGRISERKGKPNEAISYYRSVVEIDEDNLVTDEAQKRLDRLD